jgi:catechol 2,3-dioxygenase
MTISGGINHITLRVQDLDRSNKFYSDLLGLTKIGERTGMHFYSSGQYNHELALVGDATFMGADSMSDGLVHIAFNVKDKKALSALNEKLLKADYPISDGINHTISHSFYTRDPDGYVIELTTDCERSKWQNNLQAFDNDYTIKL